VGKSYTRRCNRRGVGETGMEERYEDVIKEEGCDIDVVGRLAGSEANAEYGHELGEKVDHEIIVVRGKILVTW
jgi:hypothetical protein